MLDFSVAEIAQIVGGRLNEQAEAIAEARVTAPAEFDSRKLQPGSLFIALPGENVDGHDFAASAIEAGAVCVLAAHDVDAPAVLCPPATGETTGLGLEHPDAQAVIQGLSRLARGLVDRCEQLTVVGVTGSAGKTSTKDIIASVLEQAGPTVAPPGSFNNELGMPYTVLRCDAQTQFLVAEMSARGIGHIAKLTQIAPPRISVVLNVGSAHLGEFGSRENIAIAKGELVEALPDDGVAVLNFDDDAVRAMAERTNARCVFYSTQSSQADVYATDIVLDEVARPSFVLHAGGVEVPVRLQVFGEHQVSNALAAAAAGLQAGLTLEQVATGLNAHVARSGRRMEVTTRPDGVTIINDSYNSNPHSVRAGLAALAYTASAREDARSWAVLGQMGELGDDAESEHADIVATLQQLHIDRVVAVGDNPNMRALVDAATAAGVWVRAVPDAQAAAQTVTADIEPRDVILVKASRSEALWSVADIVAAG